MKNDLNDLKKLTLDLMNNGTSESVQEKNQGLIEKIYGKDIDDSENTANDSLDAAALNSPVTQISKTENIDKYTYAETIEEEEPLSLQAKELEMIKQALIRSNGKRKLAAKELGISERTLYRKIKQFDLHEIETK
jgi:DNA-binding NtrC family response regulator